MITQAVEHYGGLTSAGEKDIATKFELTQQQADQAVTWLYRAPSAKPMDLVDSRSYQTKPEEAALVRWWRRDEPTLLSLRSGSPWD